MNKELGKPQSDSDVINKEPKVLLIGYGWVGQYMHKYFTTADILTSTGFEKKEFDHYDLAIIGVPTPMDPETGRCNVDIVRGVVEKYCHLVDIFLVKSTVEIGTCEKLEEIFEVPVCMSPEYVGETKAHKLTALDYSQFQIIGGNPIAREAVAGHFMKVLHADAPIMLVSHKEAEYIKYCENEGLMRVCDYWQDVEEGCRALHISYQNVRNGLNLDPRFKRTHSNTYHNNPGWSGKCWPKDMNALAFSMRKAGVPRVTLEHLIEKNVEKRKNINSKQKLIPDNPIWQKK